MNAEDGRDVHPTVRDLVALANDHGASYREIADTIGGVSPSRVQQMAHEARERRGEDVSESELEKLLEADVDVDKLIEELEAIDGEGSA